MKDHKVEARFKFIQKTAKIQEYRGDHVEDGLVRISFKYEKLQSVTTTWPPYIPNWSTTIYSNQPDVHIKGTTLGGNGGCSIRSMYCSASLGDMEAQSLSAPRGDEGITVKGGDSDQTFKTVSVGALETEEHVIVLKLMGVTSETQKVVEQPVTVKTKQKCPTCGTLNKSVNKFCRECGTRIE
jgi:hypothetical protein